MSEFTIRKSADIEYARVDGRGLCLDLYVPVGANDPRLLVWIHGGAWRRGDKDSVRPEYLVSRGYAMASIDFRLSEEARFPAQVHDIKAAIRFLRANAGSLEVGAARVAILGASSGGHLAALVGVTNGHDGLEGRLGSHLGQSSDVQAIVSYFGASNLTTILDQSTPHGLSVRVPALDLLLGGQPDAVPDLARLASPVFHVAAAAPPLLLIHGDQDPQMPINQSHELFGAYRRLHLPAQFEVLYGAAHGGDAFWDEHVNRLVGRFLDRHMARDSRTPAASD